mmetsp:Transcript_56140/g.132266  ORF Transcript_56140/g.132266 Transcript_56140/m.132266 type:complete len:350 (-) Transcript_56140:123-1172(-)|eukprot:CAMPEP_0177720066 /NCGR_PEP_ID=MMETSP0484_2-20121128/16434_1 /TAXON_ID=354590 /ORGANISM="Rhodomonas lens, Strain RHODO" /LENGTH=349 /DNA_ID=CAMNT_0019232317 /DNA_START=83 /DNA_END=1132 /DNA_ORIENTATION=-
MANTRTNRYPGMLAVLALFVCNISTARSSWHRETTPRWFGREQCLHMRLRGGSQTPPSETVAGYSSDVDPKRLASQTAENMATIHQNLETISLASHSSPARTSSPALVMSPHASTSAAPSSRVSPRQRANESHTTGAKAGQGESVFNRLYHSTQQREQNLERLRAQQEARDAIKIGGSPRTKSIAGGGDVFKRLSTTGTAARPITVPTHNASRVRSGSRPKPVDWRKVGTPASRGEASPPKPRPVKTEFEEAVMGLQHRDLVDKCKELHEKIKVLETSEASSRAEADRNREELQVMQGRYEQLNSLLDEMSTALEDALDRMRDLQERFPWIAYVGGHNAGSATPPPVQQ